MRNPKSRTRNPRSLFDVYGFYKCGWDNEAIAISLRRPAEEVSAALDFIIQHNAEVEAEYREYLSSP